MPTVTSSQKGWITENIVAASLIMGSEGRLAPYVPLADDHGVDLLVLDKNSGQTIALQVKAWTGEPSKGGTVQFDTRKATFSAHQNLFFAMVYVPFPDTRLKYVWFVPSEGLPETANSSGEKYALTCSVKPGSSDRASRYRYPRTEFVSRIIRHFDGVAISE